MDTPSATLLKQKEVLGGYDPSHYAAERISATRARRHRRCRSSLVHRKDVALDGTAPLLLYGYGSYGISMAPTFSVHPPVAAGSRRGLRASRTSAAAASSARPGTTRAA